jgi:hypothetical protein
VHLAELGVDGDLTVAEHRAAADRPEAQAQPDARRQLVDGERAQQVVVAVAAQLAEQAGAALAGRHRDDRHVRRLGLHRREHGGLVRPGKLDVENE